MKGSKKEQSGEWAQLRGDDVFTTVAAHELKSPLALIRQLTLSIEDGTLHDSEAQRALRQIVLVSERALRLTTNLSKAARLEDSLFDLAPLNPQQLCEEAVYELAPLYEAKGRSIKVTSTYRKRQLALANHDLLRRIILNFGDNALHYGASGQPVEVHWCLRERGKRIRIGVRDYGPSLPAQVWRRLQSQLGEVQQLHSRPQSSGLGLYVSHQFAEAMNGAVGAIRHRDGVTFYVDIDTSSQLSLL